MTTATVKFNEALAYQSNTPIFETMTEVYPQPRSRFKDQEDWMTDKDIECQASPLLSGLLQYGGYKPHDIVIDKWCRVIGFACDEKISIVSLLRSNPSFGFTNSIVTRYHTGRVLYLKVTITPTFPQHLDGVWAGQVLMFARQQSNREAGVHTQLMFPNEFQAQSGSIVTSGPDPISFIPNIDQSLLAGRFYDITKPIFRFRMSYQSNRRLLEQEARSDHNTMLLPPEAYSYRITFESKIELGTPGDKIQSYKPFRNKTFPYLQAAIMIKPPEGPMKDIIHRCHVWSYAYPDGKTLPFKVWFEPKSWQRCEFQGIILPPDEIIIHNVEDEDSQGVEVDEDGFELV